MTLRHFDLRSAGPCVATALLAVACVSVASAQSLGDLARKEEERRKAIKTPGKLYTNENLRPEPAGAPPAGTPGATTSPSGAAGTPAAPPSPSGAQPTPQPPGPAEKENPEATKDEAYWRQRIQTARDTLQRARMFADALQSRINALSTDFAARDDPAQRAGIGADRQKALSELDRVKQEIEQHTKTITAIQDEARRAGVPPGWLR